MKSHNKLPFLIGSSLVFICVSVLSIGSAAFYSLNRLNSIASREYAESIARADAGIDAQAVLLRLHKAMMESVLSEGRSGMDPIQFRSLEKRLHSDILASLAAGSEEGAELERLIEAWHESGSKMLALLQGGSRYGDTRQALREISEAHDRLEKRLDLVAAENQRSVQKFGREIDGRYEQAIGVLWRLWGGMAALNVLAGLMIVWKARRMIEKDRLTSKRLLESEERLKLALSGAEEGTWDLDIPSGRLNFDSQWGKLLGYLDEKARPGTFEEWSRLIHPKDRKRVLRTMLNHVEGSTPEYIAEYRILSSSGSMKWVLGRGKAVSFDKEGKALRVVGVTRDITHRKESEQKIWQLAHYDALTGLPNRALFYDRVKLSLAMAKRRGRKLALLFLDLDGFKEVNDLHGHDAGDRLLREVAARLTKSIRGEDFVSRLGGDEFIFVLQDIRQREDAGIVADKILHALAKPIKVLGHTCTISGSVGIALFPDDGDELETLVRLSDLAMYGAKQAGKNNCKYYADLSH